MKYLLVPTLIGLCTVLGQSQAQNFQQPLDYPSYPPGVMPPGMGGMPPGMGGMMGPSMGMPPQQPSHLNRYGYHPWLKRNLGFGAGCSNCQGQDNKRNGLFSRLFNNNNNNPGQQNSGLFGNRPPTPPLPVANSGTLVFPNHTYVRSPRDFFMMDQ